MWKEVIGFEGLYTVSNTGCVRSIDRYDSIGRLRKGKTRKPTHHKAGYLYVDLYTDNVRRRCYIHHLVLEAFVGPRPQGTECCHKDGNPENNDVKNLYWGTHSDNMLDRSRHHRHKGGIPKRPVRRSDGKCFESIRQAARESHIYDASIRRVLKGVGYLAGSFSWEYI